MTPQPDHLRCSDEDRRVVEQVLSAAYADGRITRQEHDERVTAVWEAKTFGELRPIIADLVAVEQQVRKALTPQPADGHPRAVVDPRNAQPDSDRITAIMSSHKRIDTAWRFREHSNVTTVMGDVKLDLTKATFEANECRINVMSVMGELALLVPAGVTIRDETTTIMGEVKLKGLVPEPDGPVIVLTGLVLMAEVGVYGPEHKTWKKKLFG